jgi:uncharacterized protein
MMSRGAPTPSIDPQHLTTKPLVFEGTFAAQDLERLDDVVAGEGGELHYLVSAALDGRRRKVVSCIIEGFVFLECQASLDTFRHPVSITDRLVLVDDERSLPPIEEESDAEDYLVADGPLDIRELVEDAVILALPMVPRKPGIEEAGGNREEPASKASPFAKLASLKKPR